MLHVHVTQPDQCVRGVHVQALVNLVVDPSRQPPGFAHRVVDRAVFVVHRRTVVTKAQTQAQARIDLVLRTDRGMPGVFVLAIDSATDAQGIGIHFDADVAEFAPVLPAETAQ
ncbi:hypothetical protein D3C77_641350 [compost metagenome]